MTEADLNFRILGDLRHIMAHVLAVWDSLAQA